MTFTVIDCAQRSAEWHQARCGRLTGSRAADMLAAIKSGEAAARRDLRAQLVAERLTGVSQEDGYVNAAMQRGIDKEADALAAYEALPGMKPTRLTGFLSHTTLQAGCSLDAHVGDFDVLVSVKCPKTATHLRYLRTGMFPTDYWPQAIHEMWITGARVYDFVSFDDRLPEYLSLFHVRMKPLELAIDDYERKAKAFLKEVDDEVLALRSMVNVRGQLQASLGVPA